MKDIIVNKKAYHDYTIEDTYEAGIVLTGSEIKSIRAGKVSIKEAYVSFKENEAYVKNMHIAEYKQATYNNHEELRDRKLLLHKYEISKLYQKVKTKGYTLVPVRMYLKNGKAKLEIALAKGKNLIDKREDAKLRDAKREMEKALKLR